MRSSEQNSWSVKLGRWAGVRVRLHVFFLLFALITLPVEFNASNRAMQLLRSYQLADGRELKETKEVLDAASLTYIAALAQALSTMLYYVFLLTGFSRRD